MNPARLHRPLSGAADLGGFYQLLAPLAARRGGGGSAGQLKSLLFEDFLDLARLVLKGLYLRPRSQ
ncbi:MAG TPA: hypothetical protein VF650_00510 [Allosphingosinicella sp.]|jgi:hypothetical protein